MTELISIYKIFMSELLLNAECDAFIFRHN